MGFVPLLVVLREGGRDRADAAGEGEVAPVGEMGTGTKRPDNEVLVERVLWMGVPPPPPSTPSCFVDARGDFSPPSISSRSSSSNRSSGSSSSSSLLEESSALRADFPSLLRPLELPRRARDSGVSGVDNEEPEDEEEEEEEESASGDGKVRLGE